MSKKQERQFLKEQFTLGGVFNNLFGLHFLQNIFQQMPPGEDPKFDEWKEKQDELSPIMDKWSAEETDKLSPKEKKEMLRKHGDKLTPKPLEIVL